MAFFNRKKIRGRAKIQSEVSFTGQIFKGLLRIVGILCVMALLWYGTRLEMFTLRTVEVTGGETISHEEIKARIADELTGAYFLVIPKSFTYLYPSDRILEVLAKIPRAHNIVVERKTRNTLAVSFDEYIPHALWCGEEGPESMCMFMTIDGYAFAPSPRLEGGTLIRHYNEGVDTIPSGTVISKEALHALDTFVGRLAELDLRSTALRHRKNGDIEVYINGGGSILVSSTMDFDRTYENLKSVLSSKDFEHISPGNFKYIDVRFGNKVFVNEELESATTTSTSTQVM